MKSADQFTPYEICVEGRLEERRLHWFEGLEVGANVDNQTVIRGDFDQSALHGLLNLLRDLGVVLVSIHQLESDDQAHANEQSVNK